MSKIPGSKDVTEEYENMKERLQQEIRDTDKNITKLTKRKAELEALLKNPS